MPSRSLFILFQIVNIYEVNFYSKYQCHSCSEGNHEQLLHIHQRQDILFYERSTIL